MNRIIPETERLSFRPWTVDDVEECFELARDPHVGPPCGWQPHKDIEETKEVVKNILMNDHTYAIIEKSSGKIIGDISINPVYDSDKNVIEDQKEIGFWLGYPYWNQGYMSEALKGTVEYCFSDPGISRLWCEYFSDNPASGRVQRKCGFIHDSVKLVHWPALDEDKILIVGHLDREGE